MQIEFLLRVFTEFVFIQFSEVYLAIDGVKAVDRLSIYSDEYKWIIRWGR